MFSCFSSNSLISLSGLTTDFEHGIEGTSVWQSQIQISKQGDATEENYKAAVCICRKKTWKAKVQLELKLANNVSDNKNSPFNRMLIARKSLRKILECYWIMLVTWRIEIMKKAEAFNVLIALVFNNYRLFIAQCCKLGEQWLSICYIKTVMNQDSSQDLPKILGVWRGLFQLETSQYCSSLQEGQKRRPWKSWTY